MNTSRDDDSTPADDDIAANSSKDDDAAPRVNKRLVKKASKPNPGLKKHLVDEAVQKWHELQRVASSMPRSAQ